MRLRLVSARGSAFTLVELLVVIAIIGILVSLLMPAVQSAREAARSTQCKNNVKQLAMAMISHHTAHQKYPSGGWGWYWVGDPDRGAGREQPGGWVYATLPYIEQMNVYMMPADGKPNELTAQQTAGAAKMLATPLAMHNCPSRRKAIAFTANSGLSDPYNSDPHTKSARTDYCANSGYTSYPFSLQGPATLTEALNNTANNTWPTSPSISNACTGIACLRSEVSLGHVRDGASNTYLLGEKYLNPDNYFTGNDGADNETMYSGFNNDNHRSANGHIPARDRPGVPGSDNFGSAHPQGFHMAMCDGSVHVIRFSIDPQVHRRLGHRADGEPVDVSSL